MGFLGPGAPGFEARTYSEETAREIDCAVRKMLENAYAMAHAVIAGNRDVLEDGARLLLEKETLSEDDLQSLFVRLRPAAAPDGERRIA